MVCVFDVLVAFPLDIYQREAVAGQISVNLRTLLVTD